MAFKIKNISNEFETLKDLIYKALEKYPETRDNDIALYAQCTKLLGANTVDDLISLNINPLSVGRIGRMIQNDEGMFPPSENVRQARAVRKQQAISYFNRK